MLISKCAATSDTVIRLSSLIMASALSIWSCLHNVDVQPEQSSSVTICLTRFKPFHPLVNLSLSHGALSILSHMMVNFHRFHSFCPKNSHYTTLFFDGAILQRSLHVVFALAAATQLKAEHCTACG